MILIYTGGPSETARVLIGEGADSERRRGGQKQRERGVSAMCWLR